MNGTLKGLSKTIRKKASEWVTLLILIKAFVKSSLSEVCESEGVSAEELLIYFNTN